MKLENKVFVTKSTLPPFDEYVKEISSIWESHHLTNQGPIHEKFKDKLKEFFKSDYVTLFTNGHLALETALGSLAVKGEIITTPFTFASTTHAIVRNGFKPVFCDINDYDFTINADRLEDLITDETVAIVPVHVYGNPCDVYKINAIAQKYNLKVIYDAAHVFGVEIDGTPITKFGDVSMLSFHATKVFNSIEGGALVYNCVELERQFDLYKNFGIANSEEVDKIGFNAKMNEFQAAMGVINLKYVNNEIEKRKKVFEEYNKILGSIKGIKLPKSIDNVKRNYAYYPIIVEDDYPLSRDELYNKLAENNICARKYFYPIVTDYGCYKGEFKSSETPIAKFISDRVMTLPMYGELDIAIIREICDVINIK